jgi:hypothetical protein
MDVLFSGNGVIILRRNGKMIMQFDSGEIISKTIEVEISEEEAQKAQKSEKDALELILECEKDDRFTLGKVY